MIDRILMASHPPDTADAARVFAMANGLGYEIGEAEAHAYLAQRDRTPLERAPDEDRDLAASFLALTAPAIDANPASRDAEIALCYGRRVGHAMALAQRLGARVLIVQSPYSPLYSANGTLPRWLQACADFWQQRLEALAGDVPLTVLLANVLEDRPDTVLDLAARVHSPRFGLCLDLAAASVFSELPVLDWLDALQHHVRYVRMTNTDGRQLVPCAPEQGVLDLAAFTNHLALLPQRFHLALVSGATHDPARAYHAVLPYYRLQQAQIQAKSMLL